MKKVLKALGLVAGIVAGLAVLAAGGVYAYHLHYVHWGAFADSERFVRQQLCGLVAEGDRPVFGYVLPNPVSAGEFHVFAMPLAPNLRAQEALAAALASDDPCRQSSLFARAAWKRGPIGAQLPRDARHVRFVRGGYDAGLIGKLRADAGALEAEVPWKKGHGYRVSVHPELQLVVAQVADYGEPPSYREWLGYAAFHGVMGVTGAVQLAGEWIAELRPQAVDQPGLYRLVRSNEPLLCWNLARSLNATYRSPDTTESLGLLAWHAAEEGTIARGGYDGPVDELRADIDNDGRPDRVLRTHARVGGGWNQRITIPPAGRPSPVPLAGTPGERIVVFNESNHWVQRHRRKYGSSEVGWLFEGNATLEVFVRGGTTYVMATASDAPPRASAKAYVFRLDPREEHDVCMMQRVCPCGGCDDLRGEEAKSMLPGARWCR